MGYLTLDRAAPTLSGGEAQRIRLAAQLGSNLRGVCYILDEPTIGLHPRDNALLLDTIAQLAAKGNTVVVVEHDEETIRRAEHVVDLGPGAGRNGGEVVVNGTLADLLASERSITGRVLASPPQHPLQKRRSVQAHARRTATTRPWLELEGVTRHNLRELDVALPLERLVCVTGVSGSGKSTLIRDVLARQLSSRLGRPRAAVKAAEARERDEHRGLADDRPRARGRSDADRQDAALVPRDLRRHLGIESASCSPTTTEARMRGYDASRFSFNVSGGRCEGCEGQGLKKIEMSFLPDVRVDCDRCGGARFNAETLGVEFKGKSIGDVLAMTVDEAVAFFAAHPKIHHTLGAAARRRPGLPHARPAEPDAVGRRGAARQARDGAREGAPRSLCARARPSRRCTCSTSRRSACTSPTSRSSRACCTGSSTPATACIVIEHNLDVLAEADWVVDLGPEGGDGGGRVVAQGTPEQLARARTKSHTAKAFGGLLGRALSVGGRGDPAICDR